MASRTRKGEIDWGDPLSCSKVPWSSWHSRLFPGLPGNPLHFLMLESAEGDKDMEAEVETKVSEADSRIQKTSSRRGVKHTTHSGVYPSGGD